MCFSIKQNPGGTFVIGGITYSTQYHGAGTDFYYILTDSLGNETWHLAIGGNGNDTLFSVIPYRHEANSFVGCKAIGSTGSIAYTGDIWEKNGPVNGLMSGTTLFGTNAGVKTIGGSVYDVFKDIVQNASDESYTAVGWTTSSNSFDVPKNHEVASKDVFFIKRTYTMSPITSKCYGGTGDDLGNCIATTTDGGYIIAGSTTSTDGDVTDNNGGSDFWIIKIDFNGVILWQRCYGGSGNEEANSMTETSDGGYLIVGSTASNDSDVTGNHGNTDYWVIKIEADGNLQWQKCLGGSGTDVAYSVIERKNGDFIVAGKSNSWNGNTTLNHGGYDYWIVSVDNMGSLMWQKSLGGTADDEARGVVETTTDDLIIGGTTWSTDGDINSNHTGSSAWLVFLGAELPTDIFESEHSEIKIFPAEQYVTVESNAPLTGTIEIFNSFGQPVLQKETLSTQSIVLPISSLSSGVYHIQVRTRGKTVSKTLIKK